MTVAAAPDPGRIEDDDIIQAAILQQALLIHPGALTLEETLLDLLRGSIEFPERDAAVNAVRDLIRAGLLHRCGSLLIPTRPAVRFNQLPDAGT